MINRRRFLQLTAATAGSAILPGCSSLTMEQYLSIVAVQRAELLPRPELSSLIRYATLAANSHNTQPWTFAANKTELIISPDWSRKTSAVDPNNHHLFVSLGCAAENFTIAANATGKSVEIAASEQLADSIHIGWVNGKTKQNELFTAIPTRQTTRLDYDGKKLSARDLNILETAALEEGVSVLFFDSAKQLKQLAEFVLEGNSKQFATPEFRRELKQWIRFNPGHAISMGDGLFGPCSGREQSVPTWLGKSLFDWFLDVESENQKYLNQIASSSGIAIFIAEKQDKHSWIKVGRSLQRFALQATAMGLKHSYLNQAVEVAEVRSQLMNWLGAPESRASLILRFGYGPSLPMSIRRPVESVIVST